MYTKINVRLLYAFMLIVKLLCFASIMSVASKNIVIELNKDEKLNGDNYEIWSMKVQCVLEEQEVLKTLHVFMNEPKAGNTVQHGWELRGMEKDNSVAHLTLQSSMDNDLIREFKVDAHAKDLWEVVKIKFGTTSVTMLMSLTIKFSTYKKRPDVPMKKHLRQMSNMINELVNVGHILTDEQQVQAMILSLSYSFI